MEQLNELALFSGAGGGILGGKLLGWRTVCAVEWEPYPASVLCARQNDGLLPPFPIWDDVQTFDGRPWKGIVDVVSGGFPCQDISAAGGGAGITGTRSGMWTNMARIISQVRPKYAFVENSSMLTVRGLGTVLGDLSEIGYDCKWLVMGAADVGANHQRDRIWIVAKQMGNTDNDGYIAPKISSSVAQGSNSSQTRQKQASQLEGSNKQYAELAYTSDKRLQGHGDKRINDTSIEQKRLPWFGVDGGSSNWWATEPNVGRVAHGVAARVDRLKAIGNGQVPLCAATAWETLTREYCHQ